MIDLIRRSDILRVPLRRRAPGQALVEFAVIAFVLSGIVAGLLGILVLALGSFQNNIATENAGRVLDGNSVFTKENFVSHFEMDADDPFVATDDAENLSARQVYRFMNEYSIGGPVLYDESRLIISRTDWANRESLGLSPINEALLGQYIFDPDLNAYRFPGAVVRNERTGEPTVLVPLLPEDLASGIDRSFSVTSSDPEFFFPVSDDWVAPVVIEKVQGGDGLQFRVILFHPSQPASMIRLELERDAQGRITRQTPVVADDDDVDDAIGDPPTDYVLTPPMVNESFGASSSRGEFGLGETIAFLQTIRPYRLVFETSSLFRLGASLNPVTVKYEAEGTPISLVDQAADGHTTDLPAAPFVAYEDNQDQSLNVEQRVVDRFSDDLKRYFTDLDIVPPASGDNDFVDNVVRLLPDDDGVWRVSVSAEFQVSTPPWTDGHELEIRLYKNGAYDRLIDRQVVDNALFDPTDANPTVVLRNDAVTQASAGDVLQVRVFLQRPTGSLHDVELTGVPESNWVFYERIGD
ncbi:MAG: hypothetical protein AAF989_09255 [Planctomycetota bacterium]